VSFHLQALERAVATRLLDRAGGRVRVTVAGRKLERYAARLVALRAEALGRLRAEESGESGTVTVAASTIPAEYLLPPVLARFHHERPRVVLTVAVSDSRQALAALLAEDCDFAVVGAPPRDARIAATPFAEDEIVLVGPVPNRFAPRSRLTRAELARVPLVVREEGSGTRSAVANLVRGGAHRPTPVLVGSSEAAKRCVRLGLGLTFVSRRAIEDEVAARHLAVVAAPGLPVRRRFYVARLRGVTPSAAARAFLRMIQENR
jgi:DNA-binding transcriptional LysR family regulator